jgi:hypothetical protein
MRCPSILAVVAVAVLCPAAPAQPIAFVRMADTSTAIPNGSGNFVSFQPPSVSGSSVAFLGIGSGANSGIYTANAGGGSLTRAVDTNTPIPSGFGNFIGFFTGGPVAVSGSTVVFRGDGNDFPTGITQIGIYTVSTSGGTVTRVADKNTPVPGGSGNFTGMSNQSLSGSTVAFSGGSNSQLDRGVYAGSSGGGSLNLIANNNTPIPGGSGNFDSGLQNTSVSGTTVLFKGSGSGGQQGIYSGPTGGGPLNRVADLNTAIPNGTGNFTSLGSPSVSGSLAAFIGGGNGQRGIYVGLTAGGSLAHVVDLSFPIPGGTGDFTGFSAICLSGSTVAFLGLGSGSQIGIYSGPAGGGLLTKLIAAGDSLDGRTVNNLNFGPTGLDGTSLTFAATFTDGTSGVYYGLTSVPEPSSLVLAGVVLIGGWLVQRRRALAFAG